MCDKRTTNKTQQNKTKPFRAGSPSPTWSHLLSLKPTTTTTVTTPATAAIITSTPTNTHTHTCSSSAHFVTLKYRRDTSNTSPRVRVECVPLLCIVERRRLDNVIPGTGCLFFLIILPISARTDRLTRPPRRRPSDGAGRQSIGRRGGPRGPCNAPFQEQPAGRGISPPWPSSRGLSPSQET